MTVVVDGRPIWSYNGAYETAGRIYAPLRPFVTSVADRISFDGTVLTIVREGRSVKLRLPSAERGAWERAYVPIATILRSLGETVEYRNRRVFVRSHDLAVVATPSPFEPAESPAPPRPIFTPIPVPTERPVWTGAPLPRRTPLPFPTPRP